jgi:hypothetical protein
MNKRFVNVARLGASLHLLLWLACFGFLRATGFTLFTLPSLFGLAARPHHSFLQEVAFDLQAFICYPVVLLPVWADGRLLDILFLVGNSLIWGFFIAVALQAFRQARRRKGVV